VSPAARAADGDTARLAWPLGLVPPLAAVALRLLVRTLRISRDDAPARELWRAGTPAIFAVWHSRVLLLPALYGGRRIRVLASRSRDGELLARLLARFGLGVVRGSSSRGGHEAMRLLARSLREGWDVVVAPDGPRGPAEVAKAGVVALAARTGAPIVPLAVSASSEWRARSWDGFRVPRPGARVVVRFGEPLRVGPDADDRGEGARRELEARLQALARAADLEAAR
jgi:hypothetical protein